MSFTYWYYDIRNNKNSKGVYKNKNSGQSTIFHLNIFQSGVRYRLLYIVNQRYRDDSSTILRIFF